MPGLEGTRFDSTGIADMGFDPIPEGTYLAMISKSEVKENQKKTGYYVLFHFVVLEGDQKGRKFFELVNYMHDSIQTQEIGQKTLATLRRAVLGADGPLPNTDVLHGVPIKVKLGILPAEGKYRAKNNCLLFEPAQSGTTALASVSQNTPQKTPEDWPKSDGSTESPQPNNVVESLDTPGWAVDTQDDFYEDDIPL